MVSLELLLEQISNNDIEKSIIKTCISYGFVSIGTIARHTGYPRTTVYDNITKLVKSGYVVMQMGSRGHVYGLASIESIERMLSSRIDTLHEEIELFKTLGSMIQSKQFLGTHIPQITYHEGKSAILEAYSRIYASDDIMGIFDPAASVQAGVWTENDLSAYFRSTKGRVRDILVNSPLAQECMKIKRQNKNHFVVVADLPCRQFDMLMVDGIVYHISFYEPLVMIEIQGSVYYEVQKMMFENIRSNVI